MLADLIREFCRQPEYNYEVYENYTKVIDDVTVTTLGIIVKEDQNYFEMLAQLTRFLEKNQVFDERLQELMGTDIDDFGQNRVIVYFPDIQDYHPLQP